jgi:hypothetical protein
MVSLLTPPPSPDLSCQKAGSSEGIFQLPESVLVQIFLLLPLGDRLQVARYVVGGGVFFIFLCGPNVSKKKWRGTETPPHVTSQMAIIPTFFEYT